MKKQPLSLLLGITFAFAAFTLGFFLGRNQQREPIQVQVSSRFQTEPTEVTSADLLIPETTESIVFPIDINTAGKDEFMALPGIGDVLAERILTYRSVHGRFDTVEGLMLVEGIGEKKIEAILDLITIGGS